MNKILKFFLLILITVVTHQLAYSAGCNNTSTISSNFNGTPIKGGNYIWFNSHFKVSGLTSSPTTVNITNAVITFTANGTPYSLAVPKTQILFSDAVTTATTGFNTVTQTWVIQVPYKTTGDVFAGGLSFPVPAAGLPGGINPVDWKADFSGTTNGLTMSWQWSAAVFSSFSTDYNALNVLTIDGGGQAGSPDKYKSYAIGGARGGGAANTTGSNSATGAVVPCANTTPPTPPPCCPSCLLNYPDNSNLPRSAQVFSESDVLQTAELVRGTGSTPTSIRAWYSDEHALTLGVNKVIVKNKNGTTTTTPYTSSFTPTPATPTSVTNPMVGSTATSGDQVPNDVAAGGGRPLFPALFITDVTSNPSSRAGDWQQGGFPITPSRISGTWKGATRTVDNTKTPAVVTVTPDADPVRNGWNLGGGEAPAGGFASMTNDGYGAEVAWDLDKLGLIPGHSYRFQVMVHDGDQNKAGGDAGEKCFTFIMPPPTGNLTLGNQVWNDYDGDGKRDVNEPGIGGATISLYTDNDGDDMPDGAAIKTTMSDELGHYQFTGLPQGRYIVSMPILPGFQKSPNTTTQLTSPYPNNNIDNDNNLVRLDGPNGPGGTMYTNAIDLTAGQEPEDNGSTNNTLDLAECGNSFIGDFVWNDLNGNGIQDLDKNGKPEPGINGVVVTITFSDGRTATTTTDRYNADNNANKPEFDGYYNFKNLGPGTYKITFSTPDGLHASPAHQGGNDAKDSNPAGDNEPVTVTIAANQSDFTIDAGFTNVAPPLTCPNLSLGNLVFKDLNGDGKKDVAEPGIGGLTVKLYADANGDNVADGAAVSTVMTAKDGTYYFGNLASGKYIVGVTLPDSLVVAANGNATPDDNMDNDNNGVRVANGEVQSNFITLSAGSEPIDDGSDNNSNLTLDFGLKLKAISGARVASTEPQSVVAAITAPEVTNTVVSIFPNPANDFVIIKVVAAKGGKGLARITDISGKLIATKSVNIANGLNLVRFDKLANLNAGTYFVQLDFNYHTYNQQVVVGK